MLRQHWTADRESYPGWIITPYDNRQRLWRRTEHWLWIVLRMAADLPPPDDLLILFELNWRLERCMMPLFIDWVQKYAQVLDKYRPFATPSISEGDAITPHRQQFGALDWPQLTVAYVNLYFAILREAREDQDTGRFDKWLAVLEPSKRIRSEWLHRWHYEKCLFALMRLDRLATVAALDEWPRISDEPFWDRCRAAILAELGNLSEAEPIAEAALEKIRAQLRPFSREYAALSHEGWAMFLVDAIRQAVDIPRREPRRRPFFSRWEELRIYGGDPWQEFERLELAISGERPQDQPPVVRTPDFDPGRETRTRHMASEPAALKAMPAFALLRLYEEAAVPLKCGIFSIFADAAGRASDWIAPYAPLWSLSTKIRAGKRDQIKGMFTRSDIASFTDAQVQNFYQLIQPPLQLAIRAGWKTWQERAGDLSYRTIESSVELLSRLYFRLSSGQREETFSLACEMYRDPLFRNDISLHGVLAQLFQRILYAIPTDELINHLGDLLSLPMPEVDFEVFDAPRWVEPMALVSGCDLNNRVGSEKRVQWATAINNLLHLVGSGPPQGRARAISRLSTIDEMNLLSDEQSRRFAQALWSRLNPDTGMPTQTTMTMASFLFLPEPTEGHAKQTLAAYLLRSEIPKIAERTADGRLQFSFPPVTAEFLSTLKNATIPLSPKEPGRWIDWTPQEASVFLAKVEKWWGISKDLVGKQSHFDITDEISSTFERILEVFARVILPRISQADASVIRRAVDILSEIEAAGISLTPIGPAVLLIAPERELTLARALREGLAAQTENAARQAIFAVQMWALLPLRNKLSADVPATLITDLVDRIFFRLPPALASALGTVAELIRLRPRIFTSESVQKLIVALDSLMRETEIPLAAAPDGALEDKITIPINERPTIRRYAATLARDLIEFLNQREEPVPSTLDSWREKTRRDILPEVERVWSTSTDDT